MVLSLSTAWSALLDRRNFLRGAAACGTALVVPVGRADSYPTRTVKFMSPFAPGGGTDIIARLLAQQLSRTLGQSVIVENKAGAEGAIGTQFVARSAPDGYTLLLGNFGIFSVLPHVAKTPYDPLKDFVAVSQTTNSATVLVTSPKLNVRSVSELIEMAKRDPGRLNCGASSSSPMAVMELFKQMTGTNMMTVPYKGSGPALQALMAGEIDVMFGGALATIPMIKQGMVKALATAGAKRTPLLPEVPTVAEAGVPGFAAESWNGVFAPAGTPAAIIRILSNEIQKALNAPELRTAIGNEGALVVGNTPEQFDAFVRNEHKRWGVVIEAAHLKEKR